MAILKKQILVVNCGSSSIKLSLFEEREKEPTRLLDAHFKNIADDRPELEIIRNDEKRLYTYTKAVSIKSGLQTIFAVMTEDYGFIPDILIAIGHRFVHGGDVYRSSVCITSEVLSELKKLSDLAPLHNDAAIDGIQSCLEYFPEAVTQVAVFDTAFYHSMPEVSSNYAITKSIAHKYAIKRYGFHGISHAFLWSCYRKQGKGTKIITLHLGNGCSVTAIKEAIPMDTSMGFTPAEGLVMATRAGDIDAAVIPFLCTHEKKTPAEIMNLLNNESGLLGLSMISSRMDELLSIAHTNSDAAAAIDLFCYRISKYIGAYMTVLQGAEALIFSGGIGENSPEIRTRIISSFAWFGIMLDEQKNKEAVHLALGESQKISREDSTVEVYVIATDENQFIASEAIKKRLPNTGSVVH